MKSPPQKARDLQSEQPWSLCLFVAQHSVPSAVAQVHLRTIVAEFLPPNSKVEVIDLVENPDAAVQEQVLAIPTLVRRSPAPVRRIVGDLSDIPKVLAMLGFAPL